MAAGSIVVDLLLKTGSFSTDAARSAKDLEKIKKAAYDTGRQIGDSIKGIAAALGIGLSVGAFSALIKGSIDAADHLNDLSKKTGIAVETLGGIGFAAKQAGGDLESVTAGIDKLNKSIAAARSGDKTALQGFSVVGLTDLIKSGAPAEEVLASLADKFAQFEDGPEKAALAIRIFGKAGAEMIPLLNDGGAALRDNIEYFKKYSGVTQEVAEKADKFNDTIEKVSLLNRSLGTTIAAELLPSLQTMADAYLQAKEGSDLFKDSAAALRVVLEALVVTGSDVGYVFKTVGDSLGAYAAVSARLAVGDVEGAKAIGKAYREMSEERRKALDDFQRRMLTGQAAAPTTSFHASDNYGAGTTSPKKRAPGLPDQSQADAELKKALDGRIKLIREFAAEQQEAYQFAQRYVDGVFDDGLVSLREKFATEKNLRDAALASQVKALDDEIAANQAAAKKFSGADRAEIENRIKEAVQKRADAVQKASQDDILATGREAREVKALRDSYDDLRATVRDLKGDTAGAAAIRNDQAVSAARDLITRAGGDPKLADEYGDLLGKTTQLYQAQRDYNALLEHARNQEESILQTAKDSGATEIETLQAVGTERQKTLQQLGAMVDKANELARTLKTPDAIAFAEQLGLAFRKASAEVDPLLEKVRSIGKELGEGLGNIFGDAAQKGQGLKSIIGDIGNLLSNIATKELISKPLGDMFSKLIGGSGKDGGLLGSFLGIGGAKDGGAAAATASFTNLQTIGIDPTTTALIRFQNALSMTGSGAATSGGSGGGLVDGLVSVIGGLFGGGDYSYTGDASGASYSQTGADILGRHSSGGYTGSGQKNDPAGIVHKGEFVARQEVVRQPGAREFLERFNSVGMQALKGYAMGGYVSEAAARVYGRSPVMRSDPAGASKGSGGRTVQINQTFAPGTNSATTDQAAAKAGMAVRRALARIG